jgi:hypothetical protein
MEKLPPRFLHAASVLVATDIHLLNTNSSVSNMVLSLSSERVSFVMRDYLPAAA